MVTLFRSLPPIALAFLLALIVGRRAQARGIPRVTAYLLIGAVLGPHALGALAGEGGFFGSILLQGPSERALDTLKQIALGFILYRVGSEFRVAELRRSGPRLLLVSVTEVLITAALVGAVTFLFTQELALAVLAMVLATSSAASATLLTLREVEAEGPASRSLIQLVGLNNLLTLLAFPLLLAATLSVGEPMGATRDALLALLGGVGLGLVAALALEGLTQPKERTVLGIGLVLGCLGFASLFERDPTGSAMLACFAAGMTLSNASPHAGKLNTAIEAPVYPLYVLFFLAAGSQLHLEALLHLGAFGVAFLLARTVGKVLGVRLGLRFARLRELPKMLGEGLLCQAGVALGLVHALERLAPEQTLELRTVALGSVVFFELLGPVMTRRTAVRAGEVKLANLVLVEGASPSGAVRDVAGEIVRNLGLRNYEQLEAQGGLAVAHVMRRAADVARSNLGFDRVLKLLGDSRSDLLPVVTEDRTLVGVISFSDLKDILYEPHMRSLVIAEDLAQPVVKVMPPDMPLQEALALMDSMGAHSWPVQAEGKLLGMLRRKDCYSTLHKAFALEAPPANPNPGEPS